MKFLSQVIATASGSAGGITASRNAGGSYFRRRSTPVNPSSPDQLNVRNAFKALVTAWAEDLTPAQRDGWNLYGENVEKTDALGQTIKVKGQAWYIGNNTPRVQNGVLRIDDAPTIFDRGTLNSPGGIYDSVLQQVEVFFDNTDDWATSDTGRLFVYQGAPQNPSHNFFKGPFRFIGTVIGAELTPPTSPAVITPLAFPVTDAQRVWTAFVGSAGDGRSTKKLITGPNVPT